MTFDLRVTFDLRAGLFLASALTAVPCAAQDRAVPCQLVLHNGNIATMDARNTMARSVVIRGDRIVSVGTDRGIPTHDACARVIDLRGRRVVPGLIDTHNHIVQVSLRPGHDMREIESAFATAVQKRAVAFNVASISLAPNDSSVLKASRTALSRGLFSAVKCLATPSGS